MLDHCSILHKGGIVLWSRSFTPAAEQLAHSTASPVNALIRDAFLEGRASEQKYEKDGYAVRWTFMNDLELIFVVAYQRILQLTYVEDLLVSLKTLFVKLFQPFLTSFVASLHAASTTVTSVTTLNLATAFEGWDAVFDKLLKGLEDKASAERRTRTRQTLAVPVETPSPLSSDVETTPTVETEAITDEQKIARRAQALKDKLRGRGGRRRGVGRTDSGAGSGRDSGTSDVESPRKTKGKALRKWGNEPVTESDMAELDFSSDKPSDLPVNVDVQALIDAASLGTRRDGMYEVKDWEPSNANGVETGKEDKAQGLLGNVFARLTGGKTVDPAELAPVLEAMKQHLMKKNVAKDVSEKVCESVGEALVGKKLSGFQTTNAAVRQALAASITRILTPRTSTDVLLAIRAKRDALASSSTARRDPYVITFVGVNGVGKSTNLSKVCFWLVQNGLRVLIAACDTFRSGAVEQLRVHVRNLSMLAESAADGKGGVELYERGYGKDAAGIAKEAITYGRDNDFDVVLVDTAGRMQDNEPLMRALAKLVAVNNPDKILFVGEALVGNEAVDQLGKFDRALRDFSSASGTKGRGIDGMLVTKWDTVDDKVGAALSMCYVTGQPVVFVGTGQTYTDLRQLRVQNVVQALLSD
ncbi:unnamed protein product [Peniophora sp. CBMAI 1063]|nr:unnamed protein product [Peniophora sp. CBMAI 1063]